MIDKTDAEILLRSKNLRATNHRIDLIKYMMGEVRAVSQSEIHEHFEKLDRVTLYRTLNKLADYGVIHKAIQEGSETFYALCRSDCNSHSHKHDHIHFKCVECSRVECLPQKRSVEVELSGYQVQSTEVLVKGLCPRCSAL